MGKLWSRSPEQPWGGLGVAELCSNLISLLDTPTPHLSLSDLRPALKVLSKGFC